MKEDNILNREVLDVIKEKYDLFFLAEKKVADFVLLNPDKAVESNVSELAKHSSVSDATVVRMCHRIGYKGYYEFRISLARDTGKKQYEGTGIEEHTGAVGQLFQGYAEQMIELGKRIPDETMRECVNLLKTCNTAHIIAVGNTNCLAQYMGFRLGRLGIKSSFGSVAEYFMNHINLASPEDIVVAISKSGTSKPIMAGMELAKDKGLKCMAITSYAESPVSQLADYMLVARGKESRFSFYKDYAHSSVMVTIDALLEFVVNEELIKKMQADKPELLLSESKM